jgi:hypothetical protein
LKFRKITQKADNRILLQVGLDRQSPLDYAAAKLLSANRWECLVPFSFRGSEKAPELFYDITDLAHVKTLLDTKISLQQFKSFLMQIAAMLETVSREGMLEKNVLLDPGHVFARVDDSTLKFLYTPVGGTSVQDKAALDLLRFIASNTQFVIEEDTEYARDFLDFLNLQSVFSLVELKAFLGMNQKGSIENAPAPSTLSTLSTRTTLPKRRQGGRDFVTEQSGVQTREQLFVSRSVVENILSAVSEDLDTPGKSLEVANEGLITKGDSSTAIGDIGEATEDAEEAESTETTKTAETTEATATTEEAISTEEALPATVSATTFLGSGMLGSCQPDAAKDAQAPKPSYRLVRIDGGDSWHLSKPETIIGRSSASDIQISGSLAVSRRHAILYLENGACLIADEGSSNGTFVDGSKLVTAHKMTLIPGAIIRLGDQNFKLDKSEVFDL